MSSAQRQAVYYLPNGRVNAGCNEEMNMLTGLFTLMLSSFPQNAFYCKLLINSLAVQY